MLCPNCNTAHYDAAAQFCPACGHSLSLHCRSCAKRNAVGSRFCAHCGQPFPAQGEVPADTTLALISERKQVTVLFADIKDSLKLIADHDPEDARTLLDVRIDLMLQAVHRYGGIVNQIAGDGITALFGAPSAQEDHAVRACHAALQILHTARDSVQLRVGLNSGEVVVRAIRNDVRIDYAAIGRTTWIAARLESLAEPGTALLSDVTARLVDGFFDVKPAGRMPVKGLREPITTYQLIDTHPTRSRFEAQAFLRGLSPLVGRTVELRQLHRAMKQATAGEGLLALLVGEPGVGKSRLVHELKLAAVHAGWVVLEGHTAPYADQTSCFALAGLLRALFAIGHADGPDTVRAKLAARGFGGTSEIVDEVQAVCWLLGMLNDDAARQQFDGNAQRERSLDWLRRALIAESRRQPVLLAIEDMHWSDPDTTAFLESLIPHLHNSAVLLLVTCRPEFAHAWLNHGDFMQQFVAPLTTSEAEQLLNHLLGTDRAVVPIRDMVVRHAGGNPFFLEETVRGLIDSGALVGERAPYRPTVIPSQISIPPSVHAVLAARIDRLIPTDKRVLQTASVIGLHVPLVWLQAIAEVPAAAVLHSLATLERLEFLQQVQHSPEHRFVFRHALTQEVSYSSLLRDTRRMLHAALVAAIEALRPDRLSEHFDVLAVHALRGELWDKAVHYGQQAGLQAVRRSSHLIALPFFESALGVLRNQPPTEANLEQRIELHFAARNSLWPLSEHAAIFVHLREAEELATALGDKRRLGWVHSFKVQHYRLAGEPQGAINAAECALAAAREAQDIELEVETGFRLGLMCLNLGQYTRAVTFLEGNIAAHASGRAAGRPGQPGFRPATSRGWLAICLAELGCFVEAAHYAEQAVAIAREAESPYSLATALFAMGGVFLYRGDFLAAQSALRDGLHLCEQHNIVVIRRLILAELGYAYSLAGQADEGIPMLEEAAELEAAAPAMTRHALYLAWLGDAYLRQGRLTDAAVISERAVVISQRRKERGHEAWARRLRGNARARVADGVRHHALADLLEAVKLADSLGMQPLSALIRIELSELHRIFGDNSAACANWEAGQLLLAELGILSWLDATPRRPPIRVDLPVGMGLE